MGTSRRFAWDSLIESFGRFDIDSGNAPPNIPLIVSHIHKGSFINDFISYLSLWEWYNAKYRSACLCQLWLSRVCTDVRTTHLSLHGYAPRPYDGSARFNFEEGGPDQDDETRRRSIEALQRSRHCCRKFHARARTTEKQPPQDHIVVFVKTLEGKYAKKTAGT